MVRKGQFWAVIRAVKKRQFWAVIRGLTAAVFGSYKRN